MKFGVPQGHLKRIPRVAFSVPFSFSFSPSFSSCFLLLLLFFLPLLLLLICLSLSLFVLDLVWVLVRHGGGLARRALGLIMVSTYPPPSKSYYPI